MSEDLTGSRIQRCLKRAVLRIRSSAEELDRINVFPVADRDTGHNVLTTLEGALAALDVEQGKTVALAWHLAASGALEAARGNSGMMVAELLRGLAGAAQGSESWSANELGNGLRVSADQAEKSVYEARVGTIVTVAKAAAAQASGPGLEEVLKGAVNGARQALALTTDQVPELARAQVVDAGGAAWTAILEAFYEEVSGQELPLVSYASEVAEFEQEVRFRYDIELLLRPEDHHAKMDGASRLALETNLSTMGDSLILVDEPPYRKIHIHSNQPDALLGQVLAHGSVIHCEIWDMKAQMERRILALEPMSWVVVCASMAEREDARASWVGPGDRRAKDEKGVFWVAPAHVLRHAVSVKNLAELYYSWDLYDASQSFENNRRRIQSLATSWISKTLTPDELAMDAEALYQRQRKWADGRIVTVYLGKEATDKEVTAWEQGLDAAVVRVALPAAFPVQMVAE